MKLLQKLLRSSRNKKMLQTGTDGWIDGQTDQQADSYHYTPKNSFGGYKYFSFSISYLNIVKDILCIVRVHLIMIKMKAGFSYCTRKNHQKNERMERTGTQYLLKDGRSQAFWFVFIQYHHFPCFSFMLYDLSNENSYLTLFQTKSRFLRVCCTSPLKFLLFPQCFLSF